MLCSSDRQSGPFPTGAPPCSAAPWHCKIDSGPRGMANLADPAFMQVWLPPLPDGGSRAVLAAARPTAAWPAGCGDLELLPLGLPASSLVMEPVRRRVDFTVFEQGWALWIYGWWLCCATFAELS